MRDTPRDLEPIMYVLLTLATERTISCHSMCMCVFSSTLLVRANSFPLEYLIEALLSRGAVVKDQLLLKEQQRNEFIKLVCEKFKYDKKVHHTFSESGATQIP
jgi:hypothetical protein